MKSTSFPLLAQAVGSTLAGREAQASLGKAAGPAVARNQTTETAKVSMTAYGCPF